MKNGFYRRIDLLRRSLIETRKFDDKSVNYIRNQSMMIFVCSKLWDDVMNKEKQNNEFTQQSNHI